MRVLKPGRSVRHLPAETARWSTITQIYEGTSQIQCMVMARQLLRANAGLLTCGFSGPTPWWRAVWLASRAACSRAVT